MTLLISRLFLLINTISSGNIPGMYLKYLKKIQNSREEMIQDLKTGKGSRFTLHLERKKKEIRP